MRRAPIARLCSHQPQIMDQTNRAVPHRRSRRAVAPHTEALPTDFQVPRLSSSELLNEIQVCDQEPKSSGWPRLCAMPKITILQLASFLRFGPLETWNSGSRLRSTAAWLAFLYVGFSVISFRPQSAYFKLQDWIYSGTLPQYGAWSLSQELRE